MEVVGRITTHTLIFGISMILAVNVMRYRLIPRSFLINCFISGLVMTYCPSLRYYQLTQLVGYGFGGFLVGVESFIINIFFTSFASLNTNIFSVPSKLRCWWECG